MNTMAHNVQKQTKSQRHQHIYKIRKTRYVGVSEVSFIYKNNSEYSAATLLARSKDIYHKILMLLVE